MRCSYRLFLQPPVLLIKNRKQKGGGGGGRGLSGVRVSSDFEFKDSFSPSTCLGVPSGWWRVGRAGGVVASLREDEALHCV